MLTLLDTKSQALFLRANGPERGTCIHCPFHTYTIPDGGTGQPPVGKKDLYCPQAPPSHPIKDQHSICSPPLLPSLCMNGCITHLDTQATNRNPESSPPQSHPTEHQAPQQLWNWSSSPDSSSCSPSLGPRSHLDHHKAFLKLLISMHLASAPNHPVTPSVESFSTTTIIATQSKYLSGFTLPVICPLFTSGLALLYPHVAHGHPKLLLFNHAMHPLLYLQTRYYYRLRNFPLWVISPQYSDFNSSTCSPVKLFLPNSFFSEQPSLIPAEPHEQTWWAMLSTPSWSPSPGLEACRGQGLIFF